MVAGTPSFFLWAKLQGPYVYALYDKYGFTKDEIAQLFVAGFGSSLFFGTVVGSLADSSGRKKFCLLYVVFYVLSCLTKHISNYWVLMAGRIFGGIATSLLFSVFESWLVGANTQRGGAQSTLDTVFSLSVFLNSVSAILSGTVAQWVADGFAFSSVGSFHTGGFVGPFDLSILVLIVAAVLIAINWEENYGEASALSMTQAIDGIKQGYSIIASNKVLLALGLTQSCFEASMYSFVFEWTPALGLIEKGGQIPFGTVFATFMIGCMIGSQFFGILVKHQSIERLLRWVFILSAVSLSLVLVDGLIGSSLSYYGFIGFEVCVGVYFPCMSILKSKLVPEENRSSIYNLYRIPLNAFVLFVLLGGFGVITTFVLIVSLLVCAALLQTFIISNLHSQQPAHEGTPPQDTENQNHFHD